MTPEKLLPDWLDKAQSIGDSDTLLWELCNHIGFGLSLEDCVIYVFDVERKSLIQKAVFGKKKKDHNAIIHPIEIPLGVGIVGRVAKTGKSEIVNDTRQDPDYVIDDSIRLSEMAIPLLAVGKLVGVLDTECSEPNRYTTNDLKIVEKVLKAATFHFLYLKQKEELDFMASFAEQIPFAMLRIDANQKILRHNRSAQPLIRKWGNKSGYLFEKKLQFNRDEGIQEKKWIEFTGDKYLLIQLQKEAKEKVANIFGFDVTTLFTKLKGDQALLRQYAVFLTEQLVNLMSGHLLLKQQELSNNNNTNWTEFNLKNAVSLENIISGISDDPLNLSNAVYIGLRSSIKKTKDALFDICELKKIRFQSEIEEDLDDSIKIPHLLFTLLVTSVVFHLLTFLEERIIQMKIDIKENNDNALKIRVIIMHFALSAQKNLNTQNHAPIHSGLFSQFLDTKLNSPKWNLFRSENGDFYEFEIPGIKNPTLYQELFL